MKTINAYNKIKDFAERIEKINTTLRVSESANPLVLVKDFVISIESLDVPLALKAIALCFRQKAKEKKSDPVIAEMYKMWIRLCSERIDRLEYLQENYEEINDFINVVLFEQEYLKVKRNSSELRNEVETLVKELVNDLSDLQFLAYLVLAFESFVIPEMTEDEKVVEMEISMFLN